MTMDNLDYKRVDKKAKSVMRTVALTGGGILLVILYAAASVITATFDISKLLFLIPAFFTLIVLIDIIVVPEIRYRRYKYYLDDEMLVVEEGLWFVTRSIAPIERIHQIEVQRGPIDRMFGMGNVVVTTAGGVVKIAFLEDAVADDIAARLNKRINEIVKASRTEV